MNSTKHVRLMLPNIARPVPYDLSNAHGNKVSILKTTVIESRKRYISRGSDK